MIFREAVRRDLPAIIALLADDVLGKARDHDVVDAQYETAFDAISAEDALMNERIKGICRGC